MFPIADFWSCLFETVDVQGRAVVAWSTPFWDARLLQKRWLDAWSQATDGYLRSAAFLEYMRHSMSAPVEPTENALASLGGTVEGGSLP
jgi:hypothetical protein